MNLNAPTMICRFNVIITGLCSLRCSVNESLNKITCDVSMNVQPRILYAISHPTSKRSPSVTPCLLGYWFDYESTVK